MAKVLFVCLQNAGRSQLSQALFEREAAGRHTAESAGSRADPSGQLHPEVVTALDEVGIATEDLKPKILTSRLVEGADVIVTMGCGDECPVFPGRDYRDWDLPDPSGQGIEMARLLREDIQSRVIALVDELDRMA